VTQSGEKLTGTDCLRMFFLLGASDLFK